MTPSSSSFSPTTRSRTLLFISYRDSQARSTRFSRSRSRLHTYEDNSYAAADPDADEHQGLISPSAGASGSGHVALDVDLPPKWVDISEQVQDILADTKTKITSLEKLHAKHVLPGFTDRSHEEREIESITNDITKDFRRCQSLIQRITVTKHTFPPSNNERARYEAVAAKNVQRGLAAQIQDISASFRKKQRIYLDKLQGHATKNQDLLIASGTISLKGQAEGLSALDEDVQAANASYSQSLQIQSPSIDQHIQTRDRELTEIAKSISSLAELFKDLSALVIDQGTLLDSVEYNIEQTSVQMSEAVKELTDATRYQKNTGRRKCIFLLLLIIFGLIMVLIFKPKRHGSIPVPPPTPSLPT